MKVIENRVDIHLLVNAFYAKIREDELLGPIFNNHIGDHEWVHHLDKLTDFWETNLLGKANFKGNPTQKHIKVDQNLHHSIEMDHFNHWLTLWFQTIDENFSGELADKAKNSATKMATGQFLAVWNHRKSGNIPSF
jgi:hemoglobin